MPVDDRTRLNLHRKLAAVLGDNEADTLMEHLPPVTWNEVATKDDVRNEVAGLGTQLRSELAVLRTELRSEIDILGTELRTEMDMFGTNLRTEMHVGFANMRAEFIEASNRQIKWLVTFAAAWTTVLMAFARLIA